MNESKKRSREENELSNNILNLCESNNIDSGASNVTKNNICIFVKKYNREFNENNYDLVSPYNVNSIEHYRNEINILPKLEIYNLTPKLINFNSNCLFLSNCGEVISKNNIPINWKEQIYNIYNMLVKEKLYHNDITVTNFTVLKNKIYLIDFGWASFEKPQYPYFNLTKDLIDQSNTIMELFELILNKAISIRISNILSFTTYINNDCRNQLYNTFTSNNN